MRSSHSPARKVCGSLAFARARLDVQTPTLARVDLVTGYTEPGGRLAQQERGRLFQVFDQSKGGIGAVLFRRNCRMHQSLMPMTLEEYYASFGSRISQDSERLFVDEFLHPLLGPSIEFVRPQHPFLDSTGRSRKTDFAYTEEESKLALEVNGETYHAEGIIPNENFDDNLFRQNEILNDGYRLLRFSYNQLQSTYWRPYVKETLRRFFTQHAPQPLGENPVTPSGLQYRALEALAFYRTVLHWRKGTVVLPPGTGKTILSALDARRFGGRVLFLVHRLDILKQSIDAYKRVWPEAKTGVRARQ